KISVVCAHMRRALDSKAAASTESFLSLCAKVEILPTTMAPGGNPYMDASSMMRTLSLSTHNQ
ncbi:hypothetical protein M9458_034619, partial [Cirrhinus mrigala]